MSDFLPLSERSFEQGYRLSPAFASQLEPVARKLHEQGFRAELGVVLGSGLGAVVESMEIVESRSFAELDGFHVPSVEAHAGRLLLGRWNGRDSLILQGRLHAYEALSMSEVIFPAAILWALGCHSVLLTNAAGGLHPRLDVGDFLLLRDLIDLHPADLLRGTLLPPARESPEFSGRALAGRAPFDLPLAEGIQRILRRAGHEIASGSYASVLGPNYETGGEIRMLRAMGADAVGMSTAPECMFLSRAKVRVAGISCITNVAVEVAARPVSHAEVVDVGAERGAALSEVVLLALEAMGDG